MYVWVLYLFLLFWCVVLNPVWVNGVVMHTNERFRVSLPCTMTYSGTEQTSERVLICICERSNIALLSEQQRDRFLMVPLESHPSQWLQPIIEGGEVAGSNIKLGAPL